MSPSIRISLGMVAMTTSLLLTMDWIFEIFPDPNLTPLELRQNQSVDIAKQYSKLINDGRSNDLVSTMEASVEQISDLLSLAIQRASGETIAQTKYHAELWENHDQKLSTPIHVLIPIYKGQEQWAIVQARFDNLPYHGFIGLLKSPLYQFLAIMAAVGFLVYFLYLKRSLRYLDPGAVVPSRVRAALDQLVEGVFIVDRDEKIVLANSSFAMQMGVTPEKLIGIDPSSLPWVANKIQGEQQDMPWTAALKQCEPVTDQRLELKSVSSGFRVFMTNVLPIIDGAGNQQGALASFNDISELESLNNGLRNTLANLKSANRDIKEKNEELYRLATIDPLTECLNRRAFFEKLESDFEQARKVEASLSVVMADIDHFKRINDDFGHAVGDAVIKKMALSLIQAAGDNGYVGRYGGEEFCIVLLDTDEEKAINRSDQARLSFESLFGNEDSETHGRVVTASFGVSTVEYGAQNVADLLNQADLALYESKENGRNRVTSWLEISHRKAS